jgi:hypothetical protein
MMAPEPRHTPAQDAKALQIRRIRRRYGVGAAHALVLADLRYGEALQWP